MAINAHVGAQEVVFVHNWTVHSGGDLERGTVEC